MRVEFAQSIINAFDKNDNLAFITGDLGYMALEKVQENSERSLLTQELPNKIW